MGVSDQLATGGANGIEQAHATNETSMLRALNIPYPGSITIGGPAA
ncbi:MAG: hypothetical protein IIA66_13395 [Planctomycetes bacterium]|nr:hypothetical protein [Planctomycetota bacterium]